MPDEELPLVAADLIGWRAWWVVEQWPGRHVLQSLWDHNRDSGIWPHDDWLRARCPTGRHDAPQQSCSCGIYVHRDLATLQTSPYPGWDRIDRPVVLGRVQVAGRVVECGRGFHAARATPIELWVPFHHPWIVQPLRDLYRIPVHLSTTKKRSRG